MIFNPRELNFQTFPWAYPQTCIYRCNKSMHGMSSVHHTQCKLQTNTILLPHFIHMIMLMIIWKTQLKINPATIFNHKSVPVLYTYKLGVPCRMEPFTPQLYSQLSPTNCSQPFFFGDVLVSLFSNSVFTVACKASQLPTI